MVNLYTLNKEAKIAYPVFWDYKVIFEMHIQASIIFEEILQNRQYRFKHSRSSTNAKYQSYTLTVFVDSKKDRLDIFEKLKAKAKFVL